MAWPYVAVCFWSFGHTTDPNDVQAARPGPGATDSNILQGVRLLGAVCWERFPGKTWWVTPTWSELAGRGFAGRPYKLVLISTRRTSSNCIHHLLVNVLL